MALNKELKVLIVTPIFPPDIGGPASYVSELIKRLPNKTHVITFSDVRNANISSVSTAGNFITRQFGLVLQLLKHLPASNVIYIQGTLTVGLTSVLLSKLFGKKSLLKFVGDEVWEGSQTSSPESFYNTRPRSLAIFLHRVTLNLANKIIVPSPYLKDFLIRYHSIATVKITVIPNAVEIPAGLKTPGVNNHQLIFVGRLVPWKNVDQIIAAVELARKDHPWTLTIVGNGPERSHLKKVAWITFTGQLPKTQTLELITQSKALILYSSYEGHPHSILEAHALGIPTIASDITPHQELGCFQLAPLNDPQALAIAINQLLKLKPNPLQAKTFAWSTHIELLMKELS